MKKKNNGDGEQKRKMTKSLLGFMIGGILGTIIGAFLFEERYWIGGAVGSGIGYQLGNRLDDGPEIRP